jgi:cephalosporin hydroxylase
MSQNSNFENDAITEIEAMKSNIALNEISNTWLKVANSCRYSYHFKHLDRPIIQYPQDIVAIQEIIWKVKPDLIIETGIAHGGSLILSASMLALLDMCESIDSKVLLNPYKTRRKVLGIDIDIRAHNRTDIEKHPLSCYIELVENSSTDKQVVNYVQKLAKKYNRVMLFLDSDHTESHVLAELYAYANLVTKGSYCVVFDTIIGEMSEDFSKDRPWSPTNNPKTAVKKFLLTNTNFEIDDSISNKLQISVAPNGYLKRL